MIETKYQAKIKEMMDTHNVVVSEAQSKVRRLEQELKGMNDKLNHEQRGKMNETGSLEKRLVDLQESERRLQGEVDDLKAERDRRL